MLSFYEHTDRTANLNGWGEATGERPSEAVAMAVAMRTRTNGRLAGHGVALKGRHGRSLRVAPAVRTRTVVMPRATYVLHAISPGPARFMENFTSVAGVV